MTILLFFAVMAVTIALFGFWVCVAIAKFVLRITTGIKGSMSPQAGVRPCMNSGCRTGNPMHAHFCRRCGSNLREPVFKQTTPQPRPRFNPANGRERQMASI